MTPERLSAASELLRDHTIAEVARKLGISRTTLYTHLSAITGRDRQSTRKRRTKSTYSRGRSTGTAAPGPSCPAPMEGTESMFVGAATTPGGTVNAVGWTSPSSGGYNTLAADTTG